MNARAAELTLLAIADSLGVQIPDRLPISFIFRDVDLFLREILAVSERIRKHRGCPALKPGHINEALTASGQEELIGYLSSQNIEYVPIGNGEILAPRDRQLSTQSIASLGLAEYPSDTTYTFHWLAIDGVQPLVRENVSEDSQITVTPEELHWPPDDGVHLPPGYRRDVDMPCDELRQLARSYIVSLQTGDGFESVVENLRTNGSLQILVPYFGKYFMSALSANPGNPTVILRILEASNALFRNDSIDFGVHFTMFLSVAMTPMLSESVCRGDFSLQYSIREEAAGFMGMIVAKSMPKFPGLLGIVADKLANVICDSEKPMRVHYGAIAGVRSLGYEMMKSIVIPKIEEMMKRVCENEKSNNVGVKMEALHLRAILFNIAKICFENEPNEQLQRIIEAYFEPKSLCVEDVCYE